MDYSYAKVVLRSENLFDSGFYFSQALSRQAPRLFEFASLLDHYLEVGWRLMLDPSERFSVARYLKANPDVNAAGVEPLCHFALQGRAEARSLGWSADDLTPKGVAFYLPQYHPDAQNEQWWGKGFTEWTNVTRAKPFFEGHVQPVLPGELGFYDLRLPEVRQQQATLAESHGIFGFCYYFYWFDGATVLDFPLKALLETGEPDFPFCLCWANENWTRTWDGLETEILLQQKHDPVSDYKFIYDVLPALQDKRYIRISGRPLLLVYRPDQLAEPAKTVALWREVAVQSGLDGLVVAAVDFRTRDPRPYGFDLLVNFPPHHFPADKLSPRELQQMHAPETMSVKSYAAGIARDLAKPSGGGPFKRFPTVMPSWDNTARRMERGTVFHGSTPMLFRLWTTAEMLLAARTLPEGERFVFVNAWNEWGEGAVLEPRRDHGRAYLEAFSAARSSVTSYLKSGQEDPFIELIHWLEAMDECRRSGREPVCAIGHDAQAAGAQILLQQLLNSIQQDAGSIEVFTILDADGPLTSGYGPKSRLLKAYRFAEVGLLGDDLADLLLAMLSTRISTPVLCNTALMAKYAKAASKWGVKSLLYIHEQPTSIEMYVGTRRFQELASYATHIITVSEFTKRALSVAFPDLAGRIDVVYASTPNRSNRGRRAARKAIERFGVGSDELVVLGCGAIHPRKGVDFLPTLVEETIRKLGQPVRFVWCGGVQGGPELMRWVQHDLVSRGLKDAVLFTGAKNDLSAFYAAADVFILPSREDPFPLVLLEAAAAALPVVVFSGAGGAEELLEGIDEAKAPYGDLSAFSDRLVRLLRDPHARAYVGTSLASRLDGAFSWSNYVSAFTSKWLGAALRQDVARASPEVRVSKAETRISVTIPFYNHGAFIEKTLESVACQTRPADQIIIIDDGSRPEDRERCEAAAALHPNARFLSRQNKGAHETINECVSAASGDFVAILNSDDLYHPRRLEQLIQAAEQRPTLGMFATECTFIDIEGKSFDQGSWYRGGWGLIDSGAPVWLALLHRNFLMTTSNFFFRTQFIRRLGRFRDFRYAHDLDMLQRVLIRSEIGLIRSELVKYRFHGGNTIRENMEGVRTEIAQIVAEAYVTRSRDSKDEGAHAAEIATIVRQQALSGAFQVFIDALQNSPPGAQSGAYVTCHTTRRPEALSALKEIDSRTLSLQDEIQAGRVNFPVLVAQDGALPDRMLALSAYRKLVSS